MTVDALTDDEARVLRYVRDDAPLGGEPAILKYFALQAEGFCEYLMYDRKLTRAGRLALAAHKNELRK